MLPPQWIRPASLVSLFGSLVCSTLASGRFIPGLEKTRVFLPFFDSVKKPGFYWFFLKKPTDFGFFKIMIFAMYFKIRMFLKEKNLNYNDAKLC